MTAPAPAAPPTVTKPSVVRAPLPPYRASPRIPAPALPTAPVADAEPELIEEFIPRDLDEHPDVPGFNKPLPIDRSIDRRRLPTRWRSASRRMEGEGKKNR